MTGALLFSKKVVKVMLENSMSNKYIICLLFRFMLKLQFCQVPEIFVHRNIWWKISQFILPCCCPREEPALPGPHVRDIEVVPVLICIMVVTSWLLIFATSWLLVTTCMVTNKAQERSVQRVNVSDKKVHG